MNTDVGGRLGSVGETNQLEMSAGPNRTYGVFVAQFQREQKSFFWCQFDSTSSHDQIIFFIHHQEE